MRTVASDSNTTHPIHVARTAYDFDPETELPRSTSPTGFDA